MKNGTLCPHQDYICAVLPSETDSRNARQHDAAVRSLTVDLLEDEQFLAAVEDHPWIRETKPSAEEILEWPELACALVLYLRARGRALPRALLGYSHGLTVTSRFWIDTGGTS